MKLLRIEGVNLAYSIGDTEDLSTRRGGSLMLLNAIKDIQEELAPDLKAISTGASAGLFEIISDKKSDDIELKINAILKNKEKPYRFGTFVLSEVEMKEGFPQAERSAIAQNRWQQMQSLSFSSEGLSSANEVCNRDEVRPASEPDYAYDGKKIKLSQSVKERRTYGRDAKSAFYAKFLEKDMKAKFADDFEKIAKGLKSLPDDEKIKPITLDGKIAVFYADGNSFGKIASSCKDDDQLRKWDIHIKSKREDLLKELLKKINGKSRWLNGDVLRLETLLWGGDELMFVVPGWCGMELAKIFMEQTKDWVFQHNKNKDDKDTTNEENTTKLTHACGLVFCHHQAPISSISALAKDLAEQGKIANREVNSLNWIVLESFDQAGGDLGDYLASKFNLPIPLQMHWKNISLSPEAIFALVGALPELKKTLPRSAIVRIVQKMSNGTIDELVYRSYEQVSRSCPEPEEGKNHLAFEFIWKSIHPSQENWKPENPSLNDLGAWLKLIELWDYCVELPPLRPFQQTGAGSEQQISGVPA